MEYFEILYDFVNYHISIIVELIKLFKGINSSPNVDSVLQIQTGPLQIVFPDNLIQPILFILQLFRLLDIISFLIRLEYILFPDTLDDIVSLIDFTIKEIDFFRSSSFGFLVSIEIFSSFRLDAIMFGFNVCV